MPHAPVSKSREIDSRSPAGRFDSRHHHGSRPPRASAEFFLPYSIDDGCISPRKSEFPSLFAGFLPFSCAPAAVKHRRSACPRMRCASSADSIIGMKSPAADSAASPSIRRGRGVPVGASRMLRCVHRQLRVSRSYSKIPNKNSILQRNFNRDRVLFVQHPLEKGRSPVVRSGSFIACAGVLGNCDQATEGGIPRSSRFRWFA